MSAIILDGKVLAKISEDSIKERVSKLSEKGIKPTLATILVGNDPASETYVKMKRNTCSKVGMESIAIELSENTTTDELLDKIKLLNNDKNVHGILLQHPVPSQIDERKCFDAIHIDKDVDGVTCLGFGNMSMGIDAYGSCTPAGIIRLIEHYKLEVEGLNAVVIGRSPILGKPMASAVGIPKFIKNEWIKKDSIVIDAGYHPEKCGDIDLGGIENIAKAYTPVPGGVGPMTINTLILHTLISAEKAFN